VSHYKRNHVQALFTIYYTKQLNYIYHPFLIRAKLTSGRKRTNDEHPRTSLTSPKVQFSVVPPLRLNFALSRRVESCRELIPRYKITTAILHWNKNRIERKERRIPDNPDSIPHYLRISYQTINRAAHQNVRYTS